MSSMASLNPYETIKFSQAIAARETGQLDFDHISTSLLSSDLIRSNDAFDAAHFSPSALQSLYHSLIEDGKEQQQPRTNGSSGDENANPRKRKLSGTIEEEEDLALAAADSIYARFREVTIEQIRKDEEDYARLQKEIKELEEQIERQQEEQTTSTTPVPTPASSTQQAQAQAQHKRQPSKTDVASLLIDEPSEDPKSREQTGSLPPQLEPKPSSVLPSSNAIPPQLSPPPSSHSGSAPPSDHPASLQHQPGSQPQHSSPGAFHRTLPPPSPSRPGYVPPAHGYPQAPQAHSMPPLAPLPGQHQMPPPLEYPTQRKPSSASSSARGSPIPGQRTQQPHPPQQPYPPYSQYPHPPPQHWQSQYPPQHGYPPHMPYPNQQPYYAQSPGPRPHPPYSTPHQQPYQHYPQGAPMPYPNQPPQAWHPSPVAGPYSQPNSANSTPIPQSRRASNLRSSGTSTPWKMRQVPPGTLRPGSPTRPDRDVSPLTDTEADDATSQPSSSTRPRKQSRISDSTPKPTRSRRGRPPSMTPSVSAAIAPSRSQSVASHKSDVSANVDSNSRPSTLRKQGQKIKTETPSTPAPLATSVVEEASPVPRSSGRRGRPRGATGTSRADHSRTASVAHPATPAVGGAAATGTKRKHHSTTPEPSSAHAANRSSASRPTNTPSLLRHHPSLLIISRSFAKTAQMLLNDITSHKLAGIFARPLTEREAPGYRELVKVPMDLKTLKAAVTRGGRSAAAVIEEFEEEKEEKEEEGEDEDDKHQHLGANGADAALDPKERSLSNGLYLVRKTEDLVPPKAVVNSSQLEMELTRMFANAVMFNPLGKTERGFGTGRALKLRKDGGVNSGAATGRRGRGRRRDSEDGSAKAESEEDDNSDEDEDNTSNQGQIKSPKDEDDDENSSGESSSSTSSSSPDSTDSSAIITTDAREMFGDVLELIRKWRDLENERLGVGSTSNTSPNEQGGRKGSVNMGASGAVVGRQESVSSAIVDDGGGAGEEGADGSSTPGIGRGSVRKRRRVGGD